MTSPPPVRRWLPGAVLAGSALGPLDLWGQVAAPYPLAHLFNSPAVWAAVAFAFGRWAVAAVAAAAGGVVALVVGVEAYYLADIVFRGAEPSNLVSATAAVWLVAGVVGGVVFGLAGSWSTRPGGAPAVAGLAALPAVFGAEAVHNALRVLREPADARPDDLGQFVVMLGVLALLVGKGLTWGRGHRTGLTVAVVAGASAVAVGGAVHAVL